MSETSTYDDKVDIVDVIVLPHGAGALAKFAVQIGAVRLYGCELYRETDDRGESKGLAIRWPKKTNVHGRIRKVVKSKAAAALREAAG